MWITMVLWIYLIILGVSDCRTRTVPVAWLAVGSVLAMGIGIGRCIGCNISCWEVGIGMVPGMVLLLIAWGTKKAGYADGIVLLQIGMSFGCKQALLLFVCSMFLLALVSIVLLLVGRVRKETKMPYLTFVAVVFSILQLWGG